MPLYLGQDDAGTSSYSLQDFEPSWGSKMNAAVRESWLESYGPAAADYLSSRFGQGDQPKLSAIEAADEVKKSGVKLGKSIGDGQYTKTQLSVLLERQRELTAIKDVRERTPWDASSVLRGVGMFGAGIVDPINLATAFVPWTKSITALRAARAGLMAESALTRAGSRALIGGADAGISTAVLEPAYSFVRNEIGDDYGAMDSMANIAFGTAFGGGLHVIGGGIGDAFKMRRDGMVTPNPAADPIAPPVGTVPGGDTRIRIGETYEPAKWSVIDADQLTATVDKADNQYRDRTRAAYQTEIQQRANNLDFNLLAESPVMDFGAPTLAADGRIIGGNGRALFISKAYEIGKGADYKAALEARMADLGIDPESVRGMVKPVLVRVLQREVDVKRAAMLSNEGGSTDMSPLEQAKVDAERLGDAQLVVGTDGDLNAPENRGVVRKWLEAQPENKRNSLVDEDGRLSATGIQRLNSALLFKAYGDSPTLGRLIESMDPGSRNLAMALGRTAPVLANARGAIASGDLHPLDIAGDIQQAVEKFNALRSSGMKVADYMAQLDAFGDGLTPEATMLLDFMGRNIASPRRMADAITGFYDRLNEAGNPKQGDIFGGVSAPDKMGILEASLRAAEDGMDTAAEVAAVISPETREATLRASVAQAVDGRMVDVDAIVGMDEAVGTSTRADAIAAAERTYQPENVALADFEASTAVQARVDSAPKWEAVKDAEDALAEADNMLSETVKAGDQAFKYSQGQRQQGDRLNALALTEAIRQSFGRATDDMLKAGNVQVVNTVDELPNGPHPQDVKAMAYRGDVYVVAANNSPAEMRGLMLHEVGVHVGMERMLGRDVFESVLKELDDAILRGEDWALRARSYVPDDTYPGHVREEQLAYLVEFAPDLPIVQRIIAAIRAWAYRTFELARDNITLTEADFRAMAVAALMRTAEPADMRSPIPAYARDAVQTATKAFRDWFGASAVVDENDNPLLLYHGSRAGEFSVFNRSPHDENGMLGVALSPSKKLAERYSENELRQQDGSVPDPRVYELYVQSDRLPTIQEFSDEVTAHYGVDSMLYVSQEQIDKYAADNGIRAIDTSAIGEPGEIFVIDPSAIKSATGNRGTFDPTNPDIRYSRGETQDPSTVKDELKPYDDAVKRAQQYASVLRAAADKLANDAQATEAMRAAMPDITPAEVTDLLDQLRRQVKGLRGVARTARDALRSEDVANDLQSDAMKAADQLANNLEMAAVIEKRNAALNMNVRLKATAYVNQFRSAGLDFEGFRGLLVGTERKRDGGRISVDGEQKNFRGEWLGGMIADLEKGDLMRQFTSGEFDREISVALWNLGGKGDNSKLPPEAVKIAEIVNKYQTDARNTRNRFGAWIRDLQGYITRQSHDMLKIRDAGEKAFKEFVLPRLDLERSLRDFDGTADDFLTRVYDDFASGSHMKTVAGEDDMVALGRGSSLARRESVSRVLYFKDGNASFEYNEKFGQGRLAESVLKGLDQAAQSAGLLKMLGTNPEATVTRLFDEYAESLRGDPERRAKFMSHRKELSNLLAQVDGSVNIPGNVTAAKIGAFLRAWQTMAKLGGALISSVTDLAGYAAELRFGQDKNLLSGTLGGIGALLQGRAKGEKQQILSSLGVFHESMLGSVFARFDSPDLMGGKTSAAMGMYFKLNGLNWWTESLRDGYALTHSHYLATNTSKSFDKLPDALRDMLGLYNIDAGKWDILRIATMSEADGRQYMTPDALRTVPRAALENYITSIGRTVSDASVANLQDDLSSALRTMTIDRMHHAVLEPSARTRAFMLRGTQPGTVPGEMLRFIGQFKSFPVALVQSTLGREVYGRGYDTLGDYLKNGKGDMVGLATFIALSTAMGYSAMAAKDLLRGKNPRPLDDPRTWAAAMVQGGGLGLYGDFLFQKYNRMGGTLSGSMLGPVANVVDTVADLWTRIRTGDDVAATAFNAALQNTPFMNLFYARTALDYLVLYKIQEALNPGFLRRMERRAERENGQTFYLPPTSVAK